MTRNLLTAAGLVLASVSAFAGAKTADVVSAPVPAQILRGKRVFIANAGGENLSLPLMTVFSGRADRVYSQFYEVMKDWGHYELAPAPADADLVFEIGLEFNDIGGRVPEIGRIRLNIRDPRSNVLLWSLNQYVRVAVFKGNRDKNLDRAMGVIVDGLKDLVTQPAAQGPNSQAASFR
jgi:hypothetical protein